MTKFFCDWCEREICRDNRCDTGTGLPSSFSSRLLWPMKPNLTVEVMATKDGRPDDKLCCKYCLIDAVNKADDRPKPAASE